VASATPREEVFYLEAGRFRPRASDRVRRLTARDEAAFRALLGACSRRDLTLAEIELTQPLVVGLFEGCSLLAVASYKLEGPAIADLGVLTNPLHRGGGLGRAVASEVTAGVIERGLIPQWWSLASNLASVAIARGLGYEPYAVEEGVRLAGPAV
jgi:hypothetical protein